MLASRGGGWKSSSSPNRRIGMASNLEAMASNLEGDLCAQNGSFDVLQSSVGIPDAWASQSEASERHLRNFVETN